MKKTLSPQQRRIAEQTLKKIIYDIVQNACEHFPALKFFPDMMIWVATRLLLEATRRRLSPSEIKDLLISEHGAAMVGYSAFIVIGEIDP